MSTTIPAGRMQLSQIAPRQWAAIFRLWSSIELDPRLHELIDIRASQINGCAFCLDMQWKNARAAGEVEERLYMLDAWRESAL
jgi:AhpD family alkylhydroperoxidase